MANTIFQATKLSKRYRNFHALDGVTMTIHPGEIYGLIGQNGAGKTTLMKIIGNLARPSGGSISLFGEREAPLMNQVRKQIGFLIEMPALYSELSARENLEFYCRLLDITEKNAISRVLKEVSLEDTGNKKVANFSLGMRQRLGLAIALINNPQFLVLDEPINGLDPTGIMQVREILTKIAKEKEVAILISSHILSELQLLATRFGFIHKGRLLREISSDELIEGDEKYICIKTSTPSLAVQILEDTFHIQALHHEESGDIHISNKQLSIEKVVSVLMSHNLQLLGVSLSSPTLENYYMNLIKEDNK